MTTESYTFNTIQELQAKQAELRIAHGADNVIMSIGKGIYFSAEFHIFS